MARDRDEKQLLPLVGMDQVGIIKDVPGHILPPTGFTDGKNVFFKNSSVHKRKGTVKAIDDVSAIVATVTSTAGQTMTFNVDPALTVNSEFTIANATPSLFNGTYNVTAVSDNSKTITVSQTLTPYTSGGTYTFTPKIDFVDYWAAPNNPQYIEVQQNDSATPAAPVFNSIRASGTRERISLKTYEVENINTSTTPTITIDGDPFNLTEFDLSGAVVVKPVVEREIKAGETLKVFGSNPSGYDGAYIVTSITYNTGTTKTEISCSSASVNTSSLAAYNTDSAELRRDTFSPTSYLGITSQDWQSTFFAGGYAYILNNGYHTPHYLLASLGSNYVTPQLTPLPGWDWQRYLGEEVHVSCKVIRGYKDTLIAGNLNLYPIVAGVPSLNPSNSKPGTIRISRTASAGSVPTSWQPALTEAFVEERELSTTAEIMDIVSLQGTAMVYTTNSIHSITYDSRGNVSDQVVAEGYGAIETGCVLEFDGKHIVIGADDIYMFGGHPGSIQSICNGKIRDYFYNNLSPTPAYLDNIFMVRDTLLDEIHIYYPTKLSPNGFCNEYLAWNYRNNTWTINECNDLVSGFLGPVRGGGVAGGTVTFAGVGNTSATARTDQQSITVDLDADYPAGSVEVQTLDYSSSSSAVASTYNEETLSITVPSEIIPFNEEAVEFDFNNSFNSGASSRNLGTDSGTGSKNNLGNNSGINFSVTAEILNNTTISRSAGWSAVQTVNSGATGIPFITNTLSGTVSGQTLQTSISGAAGSNSVTFNNAGYYLVQITRPGSNSIAFYHIATPGVTQTVTNGTPSGLTVLGTKGGFLPHSGAIGVGDAFSLTVSGRNATYALSNIPFGAVISLSVGGQTLTQSNTSHTFADGDTGKSWSFSGEVPTVTHASTTNSDGTLASGSGTTSPTDISGFVGFTLTHSSPSSNTQVYTLTNGSTQTLTDVDLTVNGVTSTDASMAPNDTLTVTLNSAPAAVSWSVSPGAAASFALAGDGAFPDISIRSFPANVGAATAVSYAAGIITAFNPALRAQPKTTDNTILQVFFNNVDVSGTNSNITLSLTANDGTNITADGSATSTGTRTAQGTFFTQYRVRILDNQNNEVTNITPIFNTSNITLSGAQNTFASQVGQYLRDQIITTINSNGFMTNEPDWYDNGSSGAIGSDYVVRIGSNDIENYSITVTNINTTNSSYPGSLSGVNNTFTFSDTLSVDSVYTPDTLVVKDPLNNTLASLTTRTGETIESIMDRVAIAIQADASDGWNASHNTSNDTVTFTATAQGRYPIGTGAPADSVYTDYAVIAFDYTIGSNVINSGTITDINASITTQGSDEAVTLTLVDPSRDNSGNTGPFEDTFDAGGTTNQDVANSIKNRIDAFWANWSAAVTDTGVAASGTATGNQFKVTLTSNASDWILKDRVTSTITANDVVYPADRAVFVKAVAYGSGVSGSASSAAAGTNFDAASNKSGNFIPADIQIGYPTINPTSITVAVQYANTTVSQSATLPSTGNSDSMATNLAAILNSSAVPALSATSAGSVLSITTNDLSQQINNIIFTFDAQTTQGGRNSVSRTNGNNLAGSGTAPSTTLALDTVTDADRPYSINSFNLNKFYPIVANQLSILCEGIGYTFNADPPNSVAGSPYNSFVERIQLPIDNSVEYKKNISYVQLLVDEGDLLVKFKGSDSPGEKIDLTSLTGKVFDFDSEYKLDFRENGRVFNIRIEDATASSTTPWRVSGYGFKTEKAESRGKT